jgi:polysaccharide export outer membrane protein
MRYGLIPFILTLCLASPLPAQKSASREPAGSSAEEILLRQARSKQSQQSPSEGLDERMQSQAIATSTLSEYLLGPGDVIELTVVGIPGLDKKEFALDGQGKITVPYVGQIELVGLTSRDAESRLAALFSDSMLEDPQVTVGIKEYRSHYYYVMGAVYRPGKYPLTNSTGILDALALAGGLTEKAEPKIKIYHNSRREISNGTSTETGPAVEEAAPSNPVAANTLEISLPELLQNAQDVNRMTISSGDVVEVQERKDRVYYVLGDIPKPGAFPMPANERMPFSQALASAGGMLKTASGNKVMIIRQKAGETLPEQIRVNAYAVLKGDTKDLDLRENDIVLVPGSASKTLGKSFVNGLTGFVTTLILIGARY